MAPRPRLWPSTDLRLAIIEKAMAVECSKPVTHIDWSAASGNLEVEKTHEEELTEERAQEKCMFMNSLGLVRKDLVPTMRDVMDLSKRSRLRPRKQQLTSPALPSKALKAPPPLSKPVVTGLHKKPMEVICDDPTTPRKKVMTKPKDVERVVPQPVPIVNCGASKANQGVKKACNESLNNERAQGRCAFMNSFGLVTTDHVPVVQAIMPLRQSPRLRPRKLLLPSPELASKAVKVPLPNDNPIDTGLIIHKRPEEVIQNDAAILDKIVSGPSKDVVKGVPRRDQSTRSKGLKRAAATPPAGVMLQSVKKVDIVTPPSKRRAKATTTSVQVGHLKEPVVPIDTLFGNATPVDRAKRQRRRPSKLLDSDFVFNFLQPVREATSGVTRLECNVDIRSPRSVSPA